MNDDSKMLWCGKDDFKLRVLTTGLPPPPTHDVEMMIVDGIFGSSVAFLLIKGIATIFMPL